VNHYAKYESRHPVERWMVSRFLATVEEMALAVAPKTVHEVGCGEGEITRRLLLRGLNVRGSDVCTASVDEARRRDPTRADKYSVLDLTEARPEHAASLVVCCEVLEHLHDVPKAVRALYDMASPYLIASVPREPLWRVLNLARGKYWRDWGNTPGHEQHWSTQGVVDVLSSHFDVLAVKLPLPWTICLAKKKRSLGPQLC